MLPFRRCSQWTLIAFVAGCGGGSGSGPGPTPSQVSKTAGDNQVGPAGQVLGTSLEVIVKDATGDSLPGITVNWAVASGGGSVNPASSVTGSNGKATTTRTLGPGAGTQTTTATVSGATAVSFSSVSQIQGATNILASGVATRADSVKATVAAPLVVLVKDQNNIPIANVIVTWSVSGHGQLSQTVDTTDASGLDSVTWTLDSISGAQTAQASVTGLVGSPVVFTATVAAGNADSMFVKAGDRQAGAVGDSIAHSVVIHDAYGNPKPGVPVTWVLGEGGGSISASSAPTDNSGTSTVFRILSAGPGVYTDTASDTASTGLAGSPVAFTDTGVAVVQIQVNNNFFVPILDTVPAGAFIQFHWFPGGVLHSIAWQSAPPGGSLPPNSNTMSSGDFFARVPRGGTYTYQCGVHGPIMHGTIVAQ
jgi:plastocyanin